MKSSQAIASGKWSMSTSMSTYPAHTTFRFSTATTTTNTSVHSIARTSRARSIKKARTQFDQLGARAHAGRKFSNSAINQWRLPMAHTQRTNERTNERVEWLQLTTQTLMSERWSFILTGSERVLLTCTWAPISVSELLLLLWSHAF